MLSAICLAGALVSAMGVQQEAWSLVILGRFIFGLGFESLFVANQAFLVTCFEPERLGMALGVSSAASYAGYLLSFILSPTLANRTTVAGSFWFASLIKSVGTLAAVILYWQYHFYITQKQSTPRQGLRESEKHDSRTHPPNAKDISFATWESYPGKLETSQGDVSVPEPPVPQNEESTDEPNAQSTPAPHAAKVSSRFDILVWLLCLSCLLQYSITVPFINIASGLLLERDLFVEPSAACQLEQPGKCSSGRLAPAGGNPWQYNKDCAIGEQYAPVIPSWLNLTSLDDGYLEGVEHVLLLDLKQSDIDCSENFWADDCTQDFCDQQAEATEKAGLYSSTPFIITALSTFFWGRFAVDRAGFRAEMLVLAPSLVAVAHGILAFSSSPPMYAFSLIGLGYSISVSTLWPSIRLLVAEHVVGTAFGIMTCVQNVGLSLFPVIIAVVYNSHTSYVPAVEVFLMACSALAVAVGAALWIIDRRTGSRLRTRGNSIAATLPPHRHASF